MFLLQPKYIILIAVVCGLLASIGAYAYLKDRDRQVVQPQIETIRVVVAAKDLNAGATLHLANLRVIDWPKRLAPAGSYKIAESLVGRVLKTEAVQGEPILNRKIAPDGSAGGITSLIPPGMRAMTVGVNVVSGVGGFIHPNGKVDIIATVNSEAGASATSKTVLQNVMVLAIDQTFDKKSDEPMTVRSVTLLVTPGDAEKLAVVATEASLQLTLRNKMDEQIQSTKGVKLSKLVNLRKPKAKTKPRKRTVAPPKKKKTTVEIIRSGNRSEVHFGEK